MARAPVPLNALRAFEASARHLSFTRAADELCVTQAAVSHQIKALEARLGVTLFRRSNRGLLLTDEGMALAPTLIDSFGAIDRLFERFDTGGVAEVLTVSAVGTFAVGALLERLPAFRAACPGIDLRLLTNNNQVDLVAEGLDYAIRFGDGAWAFHQKVNAGQPPDITERDRHGSIRVFFDGFGRQANTARITHHTHPGDQNRFW